MKYLAKLALHLFAFVVVVAFFLAVIAALGELLATLHLQPSHPTQ